MALWITSIALISGGISFYYGIVENTKVQRCETIWPNQKACYDLINPSFFIIGISVMCGLLFVAFVFLLVGWNYLRRKVSIRTGHYGRLQSDLIS